MNKLNFWGRLRGGLLGLSLAAALFRPPCGWAIEETFPVLQIGTRSYTNVTVTTKAAKYIFILYAGGMGNIKVADLPPDILVQLGYAQPQKPAPPASNATVWAKQAVAKIQGPQMKQVQQRLQDAWRAHIPAHIPRFTAANSWRWIAVVGALLLGYLFFCHCCTQICRKTGNPPNGILICLPFFQQIPLFHAAGMSGWGCLAGFVPVLNIVAVILWAFNISKALGKNFIVAVLLLLPLTTILAFLYLAFSNGPSRKHERTVEIMSLETA